MLVFIEGLVMCGWMLLVCVVGIANGPVGMVSLYEKNVQERVVKLGLTTPEEIKKAGIISAIALFLPLFTVVPAVVWLYNGVNGFWDGFLQLTGIFMVMTLFDRLFIDEWWVGHTKAWYIEGTDDLMPYIPVQVKIKKWLGCLIGFPLLAAMISAVMGLII